MIVSRQQLAVLCEYLRDRDAVKKEAFEVIKGLVIAMDAASEAIQDGDYGAALNHLCLPDT